MRQEAQRRQADLRNIAKELEDAQSEAHDATRKASQHAKDKARLQGQVDDLSAQVQTIWLQREVATQRAVRLPPKEQ